MTTIETTFCQGPDWRPRKRTTELGTCGACGKPLVGRNRWFCRSPRGEGFFNSEHEGESCRARYMRNHDWGEARAAAIRRDGSRCRRCGVAVIDSNHELEVNHIVPRNGQGYGMGCWNHLDLLETLCHTCHLVATHTQRWGEETPKERVARRRHEAELVKLAQWSGQSL